MFQSFRQFDRWVVAAACLLLAGKVEETPKKCKDILKTVRGHLTDVQFAKFGQDPKVPLQSAYHSASLLAVYCVPVAIGVRSLATLCNGLFAQH